MGGDRARRVTAGRARAVSAPPGVAGGDKLGTMSVEREELRRLVEGLPDERVPEVLAEVRRHLTSVGERSWPPAFFGAGRASRNDVAARSEEILGEGFGRPA